MPTTVNFPLRANVLVILADNHNPSVLTDLFLLRTGIIKNENEINRPTFINTPGLASVSIKKDNQVASVTLDPGSLRIESGPTDLAFEIGEKYCKNLPHIVGTAFGINLIYHVRLENTEQWFAEKQPVNYKGVSLVQMVMQFDNEGQRVTATLTNLKNQLIEVKLNFHTQLNKKTLGEVTGFVSLRKKDESIALQFLNKMFST